MPRLFVAVLGVLLLFTVACSGPTPLPTATAAPTSLPTVTPDIGATVVASVAEALAQVPTVTPRPTATPVPTPTPTPTPAPTPTVQDIVENIDASLVQIGATGVGWGSGFIVHADGGIITNAHVVGNNAWVEVWMLDGRTLQGQVVGLDEYLDLAYIKIASRQKVQAVRLGQGPAVGQDVLAIGFPLASVSPSVTKGIVSMVFTNADVEWIQMDAPVNPGNSGGPLLDSRGRVIGIVTSRAVDPDTGISIEGIGFALSVTALKDRLNFLAAGGQELLPISTPLPAPTPPPTDLATTDWANLWVYLFDDPATPFVTGYFAVYVWPDFDAAQHMLNVFVDGTEYYNTDQIYTEDIYLMTCAFCQLEWRTHSSVQRVSAGLYLGANLTCARNDTSDSEMSIFACNWR